MASASIGNPQSNNLYAYTQNMPTDFVDPSGLFLAGPNTYYGPQIEKGYGAFSGGLAFLMFQLEQLTNVEFTYNYTLVDGVVVGDFNLFVPVHSGRGLVLLSSTSGSVWPTDMPSNSSGGSLRGTPGLPSIDRTQWDRYQSCIKDSIAAMIKKDAEAQAKMYLGASLMAVGTVILFRGFKWGGSHAGHAIAGGNAINTLGALEHGGRVGALGALPFYGYGAFLFSQGLDSTRLKASVLRMAMNHCKEKFLQ